MRRRVDVVCTPAAASGFRLAGVAPRLVDDTNGAAVEFSRWLAGPPDERPGVVLLEDSLIDLPAGLRLRLSRDPSLLVVPFPSARAVAAEAPERFLLEILRRAIGYRVRLS